MTPQAMREKLERYETALEKIVREVEDQTALEEHKNRAGLFSDIDLTRSGAYRRIADIAVAALGRDIA
jgi:hypothetical protein